MRYRIFWTTLALKDLEEMRNYIQQDNPDAAKREAERIRKSVERLVHFPRRGRQLMSVSSVRELLSGNYRIFYRVISSQIQIARVYHMKRRPIFIS